MAFAPIEDEYSGGGHSTPVRCRSNGYAATREIRQQESRGRRIPIVALTAHAMKGAEIPCLEAGMDAHLSKPISREQMEACLARFLNKNDAADDASAKTASASVRMSDSDTVRVDLAALHVLIDDPGLERELIDDYIATCRTTVELIGDRLKRGVGKAAGSSRVVPCTSYMA